jgi:putative FmdB family regulatory protein
VSASAAEEDAVPTYQYACTECGDRLEIVQKFSDDALTVCSACGGRLRKVFSPVGIVFKGSGFYRTDSRSGPDVKAKSPANGSESSTTSNGSSDGKSGDSGSSSDSKSGEKAGAGAASSSSSSGSSSGSSSSESSSSGSKTSSSSAGSKVA